MAIPVEEEDKQALKAWGLGLERIRERCRFCQAETSLWHRATNQPVCEACAATHNEVDLVPVARHSAEVAATA